MCRFRWCGLMGIAMLVALYVAGSFAMQEISVNEDHQRAIELYNEAAEAANAGQIDRALELAGHANDLKPNDPKILTLIGFAHRESDDLIKARNALEKAVGLYGQGPHARSILGEVHLHLALEQLEMLRAFQEGMRDDYQLLVRSFISVGVKATDDLDHEYIPERHFEPY